MPAPATDDRSDGLRALARLIAEAIARPNDADAPEIPPRPAVRPSDDRGDPPRDPRP
ncbi:hypothetical protein H8E07_14575 [bacterium]|nr:hypothetical protein [bacterium]